MLAANQFCLLKPIPLGDSGIILSSNSLATTFIAARVQLRNI